MKRTGGRWWGLCDHAGVVTSLLCGIHCVALAWAVTTTPLVWFSQRLWGVPLPVWARIETGLAWGSLSLAGLALALGWWRHRRLWPLLPALPGAALVASVFHLQFHSRPLLGPGLVLAGGVLLVVAHVLNLRLARRAG